MLTKKNIIIAALLICVCSSIFLFKQKTAPTNRVYFGLQVNQSELPPPQKELPLKLMSWKLNFDASFPEEACRKLLNEGTVPCLILEPWVAIDPEAITLKSIINGDWDHLLREFAHDLSVFEYPVFIQFAANFNTDNHTWSVSKNNKNPDLYQQAFRYIVSLFKEEGAVNALWVWNFDVKTYPDRDWNDPFKAYPGDEYVDWVGVSGQNLGNRYAWSKWESFEGLFEPTIQKIAQLIPNKPVILTGIEIVSKPQSQKIWIEEMVPTLKSSFRQVYAVVFREPTSEETQLTGSGNMALETILKDPLFDPNIDYINTIVIPQDNPEAMIDRIKQDDWSVIEPVALKIVSGGSYWKSDSDFSVQMKLGWTQKYLMLYLDITDENPFNTPYTVENFFLGDSVMIDIDNTQIGITAGNKSDLQPVIWNWTEMSLVEGHHLQIEPHETGYVLTAKVPWQAIFGRGLKPAFSLKLTIQDKDNNQQKNTVLVYSKAITLN